MYFDADGNPSPTGRYEKIGGSLRLRKSHILQHGERIGTDIMMMDAAPPSSRSVTFHDTGNMPPEAKFILDRIERDRAAHVNKLGFLGDAMPPFDSSRSALLAREELRANPLAGSPTARPEMRKQLAAGRYR